MKDATVPKTFSGSRDLFAAATARATALGRSFAGHVDALLRADLAGAGLAVPPPLPPKRNGPKAKRARTR